MNFNIDLNFLDLEPKFMKFDVNIDMKFSLTLQALH